MRRWPTIILLTAILVGTAAVYLPTLRYEAIWDTRDFLRKSILLRQDRPLGDAFRSGYIYGQLGMNVQSMYYRPLVTLSFMMEKRLWGLTPAKMRAVNLAVFLVLVLLVFLLVRAWGGPPFVALTTSALFAASPLNPGNVVWVVGRGDLMMLMWGIIALICMRLRHRRTGALAIMAAWAAFALALLSKETALFLLPLFWFTDPPGTSWRKRAGLLGFVTLAGGFLALKHGVLGVGSPRLITSESLLDYPVRALQVAAHYAGVLLMPFAARLFHFVGESATLPHLAAGILLTVTVGILLVRLIRGHLPENLSLPLLMAAWFTVPFILLSFTSMWPFRLSSRYMMTASVGVFWLLALAVEKLPRLLRMVVPGALIVLFLPALWQHNLSHRSELNYWQQALADHPGQPALILKLAETHFMQGRDMEAAVLLRRGSRRPARKLTAGNWHLLLAKLEARSFRYEKAAHHLEAAGVLPPAAAYQAALLTARIAARTGNPDKAAGILDHLIRRAPDRVDAYAEKHRLLTGRNQWEAAEKLEREARRSCGKTAAWNTGAMHRRFKSLPPGEKVGFYLSRNNPAAAASILASIETPDNLDNRLFAAWVDFQVGQESRGMDRIREAARIHSRPEDYARIGRFFVDHMRRPAPALAWYRCALENRENPEWHARAQRLESMLASDK